jgi:hypothetical protein
MRIRSRILVVCALLGVLVAGCDRQQVARLMAPTDQDAAGRQFVDDIRERNFTPVQQALAPGVDVPDAALLSLATFLDAGETPKSVTQVTRNVATFDGSTHYELGYQYEFGKDLRLIQLNLIKTDGAVKISGLHTYAITVPLQQINAFRFDRKTTRFYVFAAAWVAMALFTAVTALFCWHTPMGRSKPLWLLIILLGFGEFAINWTTGTIYYDLMALEPFAVGFYRDLAGVWTLQIGFPLGAILFWIFRFVKPSR